MLRDSFAASLGPLLPRPSHPSPLVVKLGNSFHPQGLGQFREGWENLLNRVAEALTGCTGRSYLPPAGLSLSCPTEQRQRPHGTNRFITLWVDWVLWKAGGRVGV